MPKRSLPDVSNTACTPILSFSVHLPFTQDRNLFLKEVVRVAKNKGGQMWDNMSPVKKSKGGAPSPDKEKVLRILFELYKETGALFPQERPTQAQLVQEIRRRFKIQHFMTIDARTVLKHIRPIINQLPIAKLPSRVALQLFSKPLFRLGQLLYGTFEQTLLKRPEFRWMKKYSPDERVPIIAKMMEREPRLFQLLPRSQRKLWLELWEDAKQVEKDPKRLRKFKETAKRDLLEIRKSLQPS